MAELGFTEPGERRWLLALPSGGRIDLLIIGAESGDGEFIKEWLALVLKNVDRVFPPVVSEPSRARPAGDREPGDLRGPPIWPEADNPNFGAAPAPSGTNHD